MAANNPLLINRRPRSHLITDYMNIVRNDGASATQPSRHHVIPFATLKDFFNTVITRSDATEFQELGKGLKHLIEKAIENEYTIDERIVTRGRLEEAKELAHKMQNGTIRNDTVFTDQEKVTIATIHTVFSWMPGNIFIAPGAGRINDPGSNFEFHSDDVVPHYEQLCELYEAMVKYIEGIEYTHSFADMIHMIEGLPNVVTPYDPKDWDVSNIKARDLFIRSIPQPNIPFPNFVKIIEHENGYEEIKKVNAKVYTFLSFDILQKFFNKVIVRSKDHPDDLKKLAEGLLLLIYQAYLDNDIMKNNYHIIKQRLDHTMDFVELIQNGDITVDTALSDRSEVITTIRALYLWMPGNIIVTRDDLNISDPEDWFEEVPSLTPIWNDLNKLLLAMHRYYCIGRDNDTQMDQIIDLLKRLHKSIIVLNSALMITSCPSSHLTSSADASGQSIIPFHTLKVFFNAVLETSKVNPEELQQLARGLRHLFELTIQNYNSDKINNAVVAIEKLEAAKDFVLRIENGDITTDTVFSDDTDEIITTIHTIFVWLPGNVYDTLFHEDGFEAFEGQEKYQDFKNLQEAMVAYSYWNIGEDGQCIPPQNRQDITDLIDLLIKCVPDSVFAVVE